MVMVGLFVTYDLGRMGLRPVVDDLVCVGGCTALLSLSQNSVSNTAKTHKFHL